MNQIFEKRIEAMKENELMKELIAADGIAFNEMIEIIKRKRFEYIGIAYLSDDDIANMDTPEE